MYGATAIQTTLAQVSHGLRRSTAEGPWVTAVERVRPAKEELARAQRDAEEQLLAQRRRDKRDHPDGPHGFSRPLSPSGYHAQLLAQLTEPAESAIDARHAEALAAYPVDEAAPDMEILEPIVFDGDEAIAGGGFAPGEVRITLDILV